jgi:hypothetical protein
MDCNIVLKSFIPKEQVMENTPNSPNIGFIVKSAISDNFGAAITWRASRQVRLVSPS